MARQLTIVTGGGRCGTAFFGRRLSQMISDCFSVHEPDILYRSDPDLFAKIRTFGLYQTVIGKLLGRRGLRTLSIRAFRGTLSDQAIDTRLKRERQAYYASLQQRSIVEANAAWWGVSHRAGSLCPDTRVAVIIRHPVSWIRSWTDHGGLHDRRDLVGTLGLGRLDQPEWGTDTGNKLAHTWATIYGRLDALCEQRDDHRLFRFEDLFGDSSDSFDAFLGFVCREDPSRLDMARAHALRVRPTNVSRPAGSTPTIDPAGIAAICGPLAARHGYRIGDLDV